MKRHGGQGLGIPDERVETLREARIAHEPERAAHVQEVADDEVHEFIAVLSRRHIRVPPARAGPSSRA